MSGGRVQLGPNFDRLTGKRRPAESRYVRTPRSTPARRTAFPALVAETIREHRRAYGEQCGCTVCVLARRARKQGSAPTPVIATIGVHFLGGAVLALWLLGVGQ